MQNHDKNLRDANNNENNKGRLQNKVKAKRQKLSTPIVVSFVKQEMNEVIGLEHPLPIRFFAAMLRTNASSFLQSASNRRQQQKGAVKKDECWHTICQRLGIAPPISKLKSFSLQDATNPAAAVATQHVLHLAALVVEEARAVLAEALQQHVQERNNHQNNYYLQREATVQAHNGVTAGDYRNPPLIYSRLILSLGSNNNNNNTTLQQCYLRVGSVFLLHRTTNGNRSTVDLGTAALGVVLSTKRQLTNETQKQQQQSLELYVFDSSHQFTVNNDEPTKLLVTPLETLISQFRCFEAMMLCTGSDRMGRVLPLLGGGCGGGNCHQESPPNEAVVVPSCPGTGITTNSDDLQHDDDTCGLNPTQFKAATSFLKDTDASELTIVQGPPGSGKQPLFAINYVIRRVQTYFCV
jgi:hypothetical protein